jgi:hypothetical protein
MDRGVLVDIGKTFTFVFDDEEWIKKVLIGALLALTGIGMIPVLGYAIELSRRVARGDEKPLPEWEEFGAMIVEGFLTLVVGFVWALPLIIIASCVWIVPFLLASIDNSGDMIAAVSSIMSICVMLISLVYGLILGLVLPAALTNYAVTGELGAAFRFGEIIGMVRNNLGTYLMVLLISIIAQMIGSLGSIILCIGVYATAFYSIVVTYHSYGQAYRIAAGNVDSSPELTY